MEALVMILLLTIELSLFFCLWSANWLQFAKFHSEKFNQNNNIVEYLLSSSDQKQQVPPSDHTKEEIIKNQAPSLICFIACTNSMVETFAPHDDIERVYTCDCRSTTGLN